MDKGGDGGTLTDGPKILAFCCLNVKIKKHVKIKNSTNLSDPIWSSFSP